MILNAPEPTSGTVVGLRAVVLDMYRATSENEGEFTVTLDDLIDAADQVGYHRGKAEAERYVRMVRHGR